MELITYPITPVRGKEKHVVFRRLAREIPSTTHGVFGIYRYPAKFIPQVIAYILENYSSPGMTVLDPFAGSGTVGLVARMYGLKYELWDLNPMLEVLHSIAIMKPIYPNISYLTQQMVSNSKSFAPKWLNITYWFPKEVIPFLYKVWGFYHSLKDADTKKLILIPLLKTTRLFSYNDPQRQKLSRSPLAFKRVKSLLEGNWKTKFINIFQEQLLGVFEKLQENDTLLEKNGEIHFVVRGGVNIIDVSRFGNFEKWDMLITSPPYLQAQEYIRNSKIDLLWMGYSEEEVRGLARKELPYGHVDPIEINSETYFHYHKLITEQHLVKMFERYFYGVLGSLSYLARNVKSYMFLFVGQASVRGQAIPIDRIFIEHFTASGWKHIATLIDSIVSRVMFRSKINPATGLKDNRMASEHLVILRR